jgi:uncharacterized phage-associated protein
MTMPRDQPSRSDGIDTFRGEASSRTADTKATMITPAVAPVGSNSSPVQGLVRSTMPRYGAAMTSANSVVTAIEARRLGLKPAKLHLLLFFCQGHHLAHTDDPLFAEALYATERGITLDDAPVEPGEPVSSEGQLNTIGYVIDRYGALTHSDLRTLVQASTPWQLAMKSTSSPRIEWAWLRDWFRRPDETDDPDDERPNRAESAEVEAYLAAGRRR